MKHLVTVLLLAGIAITVAISLFLGGLAQQPGAEETFVGTDAQVTEMLDEQGAQPWFEPIFEPGSSELESGLFAAQAAIGGCVLGYCIGRLQGRRREGSTDGAGATRA
ncbi:energy-coupling factor ABC transporter substrate-binding protein [Mobilicoccus caccae]|uniref:Cobalt transport protein CbiN n=1 Tax=Mobilicoccus caccae TaxID=1859295 RepID=A0ABQ6IRZ7_9MICO|nr:energy-coupling factor ABC transporter substrate-binding protein [Mobilicoccus caccae]GMA40125.1 cobalt transport protein CbiN [Mobilicoccus caccae]